MPVKRAETNPFIISFKMDSVRPIRRASSTSSLAVGTQTTARNGVVGKRVSIAASATITSRTRSSSQPKRSARQAAFNSSVNLKNSNHTANGTMDSVVAASSRGQNGATRGEKLDNGKLPASNHNTRAKNGIRKERRVSYFIGSCGVELDFHQFPFTLTGDVSSMNCASNTDKINIHNSLSVRLLACGSQASFSDDDRKNSSGVSAEVEECAFLLAQVDRRAYSRALLRDSNSLLDNLVFPMCFPWAHHIEPVAAKAIPRDIDEMQGILSLDDHAVACEFKAEIAEQPHTTNTATTATVWTSTQRSCDPGVIEYTRMADTSSSTTLRELSTGPYKRDDSNDEDTRIPGELSLRSFQHVQARKRQRVETLPFHNETTMISIRFGSTSSRERIFESAGKDSQPLLLPALLPPEVQNGKRLNPANARISANQLGSYDNQHGFETKPSAPSADGSRVRLRAGRTRLTWTTKVAIGRQRPSYRSLLTGMVMENGSQRRPTHVLVAVRVNGNLISSPKDDVGVVESRASKIRGWISDDHTIAGDCSHSKKDVESALDAACTGHVVAEPVRLLQCSLNCDQVLSKGLKLEGISSRLARNSSEQYTVQLLDGSDIAYLRVVPPRIEAMPTESGLVRVLCSQPGRLEGFKRSNSNISEVPFVLSTGILLDEMASKLKACAVCWSSSTESEDIITCASCGLRVHYTCHSILRSIEKQKVNDAVTTSCPTENWQCNACAADRMALSSSLVALPISKATNPRYRHQCKLCPHRGGAINKLDSNGKGRDAWVHDTCRIWCGPDAVAAARADTRATTTDPSQVETEETACCLCSQKCTSAASSTLIRCAAQGCSLLFHPMCAVVASKAADLHRPVVETRANEQDDAERVARDAFLCSQYQLSMLSASTSLDYYHQQYGKRRILPFAYCGFHNQQRRPDYYGIYSGARFYNEAMRVPPQRKLN
jgi:PHD-zinc-finger like domain